MMKSRNLDEKYTCSCYAECQLWDYRLLTLTIIGNY